MKSAFLSVMLLILPISAQAEIVLIDSDQAFNAEKKLVEFREQIPVNQRGTFEPIDLSFYPHAAPLTNELAKRIESMLTEQEKQGRVFVMVSRSLTTNAHFVDLGNGDRLIGISIGLLWVMADEDKTVSIIGHELEHGWSKIQDVVNQKKNGRAKFLQRVVENEVDIKSVFKRVIKIGGNPYAMKAALRILRERYGNGVSETHTTLGSREDALDSAVTIARRELGKEGITLSTDSRLQGGMTSLLLSSDISALEYEKILVAHLAGRLEGWVEEYVNADISRLYASDRERNLNFKTQSDVFELVWARLMSYFDISMQAENYHALRLSLVKSVVNSYANALNHELENGKKIHHRSEIEIRRLLTISTVLSRQDKVASAKSNLERTSESYKEALKHYNIERVTKGDDADRGGVDYLLQKIQEYKEELATEINQQAVIDSVSAGIKAIRLRIVRQSVTKLSNLYDWGYLQELQLPQDRGLMTYVVDKMTTISRLDGDDFVFNFWPFLERTDAELLDLAFRNFCRSAVLNQSYRGINKYINPYAYPMAALTHLKDKTSKTRLRTIAQQELVLPLQKMAEEMLNGTFVRAPHPDPQEREDREEDEVETATKRLSDFSDIIKAIKTLAEHLKDANLIFNINASITDKVKARFNSLINDSYSELHANLRAHLTHSQYRRIIVLNEKIESAVGDNQFSFIEVEDMLKMREVIIKHFPIKISSKDAKLTENETRLAHNISSILRDRGYESFFELLRAYGEKNAQKDTNKFFELAYRISRHVGLSFYRYIDYNSLSVDADCSLQSAYARWLIANYPETLTDDNVFTETTLLPTRSRHTNLTAEQEATLQQNENSIEKMNYEPLTRAKLDLSIIKLKEDLSDNIGLTDEEKIDKLIEHVGGKVIIEHPNHVLSHTGVEISLAFNLVIKKLGLIENNEYTNAVKYIRNQIETETDLSKLLNYYDAFYTLCAEAYHMTTSIDADFEHIWTAAERQSEPSSALLRQKIAKNAVVSLLRLRRNKTSIFKFRFSTEINPAQVGQAPDITSIRPDVTNTIELLTELFPETSDVRDTCIDIAGKALLTNPAETDAMYELSTNLENFQNNDALVFLDMPDAGSRLFRTNKEKIAWLRYFTGQLILDDLITELGPRLGVTEKYMRLMATHALINFQDADVLVRGFILLPLLDDLNGLLSDDRWRQEVKDLVLGPYAKNNIASATYDSYFRALPPGERRVVLAGILAGFIDRERGEKGFITNLVNGLKAMGIKSAQLFRASGFAPKEFHAELDSVFDAALPVRRDRALKILRQAFGADLKGLAFFGESLGFGSVNHVWHLVFNDPSGEKIDTAVRMLRENVIGQVRNENEVWVAALRDLKQNQDPAVRHFANQIEQVRLAIVPNLVPGGAEVDFVKDREIHDKASASYSGKGLRSGRNISLVPLAPSIQEMVSPEMQSSVTVMQLIRQTRLAEHPQQAILSEDALRTELRAAFRLGKFDADGHVGNWLPSRVSNDLYRTDWSLFTALTAEETEATRNIFKAMLAPRMTRWGRDVLLTNLDHLFVLEDESSRSIAIQTIESLTVLEGDNPVDRIYYLRSNVENALRYVGDSGDSLNLNTKMLMAIHSIAKTRMHIESMGEGRYNKVFSEELGVNMVDKGRIVGSKIKQAVISACEMTWSR